MNVVTTVFLGMAPERPVWLRRMVQVFWALLAVLVVIAWAYGLAALIRAV